MGDKPKRYLLKNISKMDVNIGDLRYRIPAEQTRDLLSKTAHLLWEDILCSRKSGSIAKRLGKSLIEVDAIIVPKPPQKTMAEPTPVKFPQRVKSYITIGTGNTEEAEELARSEDEEFIKEMEEGFYYDDDDLPVITEEE